MSDLAKELRRFSFHDKISTMPWETLKLIDAAADRIEELEALVEKYRAAAAQIRLWIETGKTPK